MNGSAMKLLPNTITFILPLAAYRPPVMKDQFNEDSDILAALQSQDNPRINAALKHLYSDKLRSFVRQQVYALGGGDEDARECLNEALLKFLQYVEDGKYDPSQSRISTYIVKIATQMYHTKRRSQFRREKMHDRSMDAGIIETETNPEEAINHQHRKDLLDRVLSMIGDKCRQLLQWHGASFSMAEIAEKVGYKSTDVAKMAVQDCRKKLNQFLSQRPDLLAELREL